MNQGGLTKTFDTAKLSVGAVAQDADWMTADAFSGGWTVRRNADGSLQLLRGGQSQGHGGARSASAGAG